MGINYQRAHEWHDYRDNSLRSHRRRFNAAVSQTALRVKRFLKSGAADCDPFQKSFAAF